MQRSVTKTCHKQKNNMRKVLVLLLVIIASIVGCRKNSAIGKNQFVTLKYNQTYCSDPWPTGSNDSLTLKNVSNYLNAQGLYNQSLSIKQEATPQVCSACNCKSGKIIYVSTLDSDSLKTRYQNIGFTQ
jgi:hypothetical protein